MWLSRPVRHVVCRTHTNFARPLDQVRARIVQPTRWSRPIIYGPLLRPSHRAAASDQAEFEAPRLLMKGSRRTLHLLITMVASVILGMGMPITLANTMQTLWTPQSQEASTCDPRQYIVLNADRWHRALRRAAHSSRLSFFGRPEAAITS